MKDFKKWVEVPEAELDDGTPTLWAVKVGHDEDGDHFIWVSLNFTEAGEVYNIESSWGTNLNGRNYKTLKGAQREAEKIGARQARRGWFSD